MHPDATDKPFGKPSHHPDQPPPSEQPNASARPTEPPAQDQGAPTDSATAAQRAMKQTSKTVQEDGTARE